MPIPPSDRRQESRRRPLRLAVGLGLLGVCLGCAGCTKAIYRQGDPRTQYDRYDSSRNQFVPDYIADEYGRLEPNLRGRLLVKN